MARTRLWLRVISAAAPVAVLACVGTAFPSTTDDHGHAEKPAAAAPAAKPKDDAKPAAGSPGLKDAGATFESKPKAKPALDDDHDDASGGSHRVDGPSRKDRDKNTNDDNAKSGGPERAPKRGAAATAEAPADAESALRALKDGNARWVSDRCESPNTGVSRRETLARDGQKPFAQILTCIDSRLPVERLFDRGVGDLLVTRVGGNVAGASEIGSLEYGVEHLHIPLLVVMGHTKCGAVGAAASHAKMPGALGELLQRINPAVERAEGQLDGASPDAVTAAAIKENVWQSIFDLLRFSPEIRAAISEGKVKVVGALCDVSTGKVEFMGEHPWQAELVAAFNGRKSGTEAPTAHAEEGR